MMVKTEAYGLFGSGEKQRAFKQRSCIGKGGYFFRNNTHYQQPSTKSTATTIITTHQQLSSCPKNVSYFNSSTPPEKMDPRLEVVGSSWLMTKKRWTGIRKKSFTNLTPFTFPKLKPYQSLSYNVPHVPSSAAPLARANLKFLFEKRLQKSDVGGLKRVILPKHPAESYLPTLQSKEGFFIWMDDMDGEHCWKFKFRFWPNNTSRMYVLENTGDFTDEHNLEEGDHILFYQDCDTNEYVVQAKKDKASNDSDVDYEVQDSSSDVLNDTFDDDLPREAKTPQKQGENGIVNYFVYEDRCISEFHNDKLNNTVEVIPPYHPLVAPDEGEDGDDDIDKYLCLEGPESSINSAVNSGIGILPSEPETTIRQEEKGKEVAHEDKGTLIGNANKVADNLLPLEHDISPKGEDASTSTAKAAEIPNGFFFYAPDNIPGGITYKLDEWGMPYGYETSNDPYLDFGSTCGF